MGAIGGHHAKWIKPDSETQRRHIFSHMWKIDPEDKCIHRNKHDLIETHMLTYL
jgi:hypothetical protein